MAGQQPRGCGTGKKSTLCSPPAAKAVKITSGAWHCRPAEIAEIREAEQRLAANILGVKDVIFLGQPDGRVEPTLAFRDQIVNVLRRLRPQIVISMDPGVVGVRQFLPVSIQTIGPRR